MTLFELIQQETAGSRLNLVLIAGLSGIANAGLLAIINSAIQSTSSEMQSFRRRPHWLFEPQRVEALECVGEAIDVN